MGNVCQFCGKNPHNILQKFSRGWCCDFCLRKYDLTNHSLLTNEIEIDSEITTTDNVVTPSYEYYNDWGWGGWGGWDCTPYKKGLGWYSTPKKCTVTIEEMECNPNDLSAEATFVLLIPTAQKLINKAKKWVVEFFPLG